VYAAGLLACTSSRHQQRAVCWGAWGSRGGAAAGGLPRLYSQPVEPAGGSGGGVGQAHLDPPRHCHLAGCQGFAESDIVYPYGDACLAILHHCICLEAGSLVLGNVQCFHAVCLNACMHVPCNHSCASLQSLTSSSLLLSTHWLWFSLNNNFNIELFPTKSREKNVIPTPSLIPSLSCV